MASYSIAEAKDRLSALIHAAKHGEAVVITRYGKPEATITAIAPHDHKDDLATTLERLRIARAKIPYSDVTGAQLVGQMRDEDLL